MATDWLQIRGYTVLKDATQLPEKLRTILRKFGDCEAGQENTFFGCPPLCALSYMFLTVTIVTDVNQNCIVILILDSKAKQKVKKQPLLEFLDMLQQLVRVVVVLPLNWEVRIRSLYQDIQREIRAPQLKKPVQERLPSNIIEVLSTKCIMLPIFRSQHAPKYKILTPQEIQEEEKVRCVSRRKFGCLPASSIVAKYLGLIPGQVVYCRETDMYRLVMV